MEPGVIGQKAYSKWDYPKNYVDWKQQKNLLSVENHKSFSGKRKVDIMAQKYFC